MQTSLSMMCARLVSLVYAATRADGLCLLADLLCLMPDVCKCESLLLFIFLLHWRSLLCLGMNT